MLSIGSDPLLLLPEELGQKIQDTKQQMWHRSMAQTVPDTVHVFVCVSVLCVLRYRFVSSFDEGSQRNLCCLQKIKSVAGH